MSTQGAPDVYVLNSHTQCSICDCPSVYQPHSHWQYPVVFSCSATTDSTAVSYLLHTDLHYGALLSRGLWHLLRHMPTADIKWEKCYKNIYRICFHFFCELKPHSLHVCISFSKKWQPISLGGKSGDMRIETAARWKLSWYMLTFTKL